MITFTTPKSMKNILFFLAFLIILFSCSSDKKIKKEVSVIPVKVEVIRFDQKFAAATPENLSALKKEFPYLFPEQYPDSIWIEKMQDTLQLELETEVNKVYADFSEIESEIESLFQHLKYYFPSFKEPKIITVISDVDYRNKIAIADTLLVIGLDNFLGKEHFFYVEIPVYITKNLIKEQLTPSIAEVYAEQLVPKPSGRTLLDAMVYFGKLHYLKEMLLPLFEENLILGYTKEELQWAQENESEIWRYFVEREMLFGSDPQLMPRFINPAPFTKFYLELDNESPGRLGQYMGWQIVKAYAENNDVSLARLMATPTEELFNNAKFKPRR